MSLNDFYHGDTWNFNVEISYNAQSPTLNNDTVQLFLKTSQTDSNAQAALSHDADVTTYGSIGKAVFVVPKAKTQVLTPDLEYYYGLVWIQQSGKRKTLEEGKVTPQRTTPTP